MFSEKIKLSLLKLFLKFFEYFHRAYWGFPGRSDGKELPAMQETRVQSLDREDPLEKGMTTHSSILTWRIQWTEIIVHGVAELDKTESKIALTARKGET